MRLDFFALNLFDFFDARRVTPVFKRGAEPCTHNLFDLLRRVKSCANGEHIRVVMLAGEPGRLFIPRDCRAHALLMLIFWGLSAVPLEVAFGLPGPGSAAVVRERAQAATFVLDLVDATRPA